MLKSICFFWIVGVTSQFAYSLPSPSTPRESEQALDGVTHLARAADKSQMYSEGRLPMDLEYPCPKDQKLLSFLGLDSTEFSNIVSTSDSDSALTVALKSKNPTGYASLQSSISRFSTVASPQLKINNEKYKGKYTWGDNDGC
jgi:hypothetical protein